MKRQCTQNLLFHLTQKRALKLAKSIRLFQGECSIWYCSARVDCKDLLWKVCLQSSLCLEKLFGTKYCSLRLFIFFIIYIYIWNWEIFHVLPQEEMPIKWVYYWAQSRRTRCHVMFQMLEVIGWSQRRANVKASVNSTGMAGGTGYWEGSAEYTVGSCTPLLSRFQHASFIFVSCLINLWLFD